MGNHLISSHMELMLMLNRWAGKKYSTTNSTERISLYKLSY